jgi:HSP20 family protein
MAFPSIFRINPDHSIDRLFDDVWRSVASQPVAAAFAPRLDVVERESEFLVNAELPGLEEKDFSIEVHGSVLALRGEKKAEHVERKGACHWSERSYGSFRRVVELPVDVQADRASASFKNGVLTITLPKAESAKVRHIPVNAG